MDFLLILLIVLGIILLATLIVLCVRLIFTLGKVDMLLDDAMKKMNSVNKVFEVVDKVTNSMSLVNDKMIDAISSIISKLFAGRKKNEKLESEEEF